MSTPSSFRKTLHEIASKQEFAKLDPYKTPQFWQTLSPEDKEELAFVVVAEGTTYIESNILKFQELLKLATSIAPQSAEVIYREAYLYSLLPDQILTLTLAHELAEQAGKMEPHSSKIMELRIIIAIKLGEYHQDIYYFSLASQLFQQMSQDESKNNAALYWNWGRTYAYMGKASGEASDFSQAINKYREAEKLGMNDANFWFDYGNALSAMAQLATRPDLLTDAAEMYQKTIRLNSHDAQAWLKLALTYHALHFIAGSDTLFDLAHECFGQAMEMDPQEYSGWLAWASLLAVRGKENRENSLILESLTKFQTADQCEPENATLLARWAEAEIWLGESTENLTHLKSAEQRIINALGIAPESPDIWYLYAVCQHELSRYFNEQSYEIAALEKLEYGLTLHPKHPLLWYGKAMSLLSIGEVNGDADMIQKSLEAFSNSKQLNHECSPSFWNDWGVAFMKMAEVTGKNTYLNAALEKFEYVIHQSSQEDSEEGIDPEILYNYGCALDFLGDHTQDEQYYEKSIQVLTQVIEIDSDYTFARYNLALSWSHLGEVTDDVDCFHKANEQFQILSTMDPEDEFCWSDWGLSLIHLAQLLIDPSHPELGEKWYVEAEDKLLHAASLGHTQAHYHLACLYSLMEQLPNALAYMEKAEKSGALPPIDDLLHDEWLENLRQLQGFRIFINNLVKKSGK